VRPRLTIVGQCKARGVASLAPHHIAKSRCRGHDLNNYGSTRISFGLRPKSMRQITWCTSASSMIIDASRVVAYTSCKHFPLSRSSKASNHSVTRVMLATPTWPTDTHKHIIASNLLSDALHTCTLQPQGIACNTRCPSACLRGCWHLETNQNTRWHADLQAHRTDCNTLRSHACALRGLHEGHLVIVKFFRDRTILISILQQHCPLSLSEMHFGQCMLDAG
jgi:hypothetical protein